MYTFVRSMTYYESVREYVVCMCLCMCVCVFLCACTVYTYMYTYIYIYISYMNAFYSVCIYTYIYICVCRLLKKMAQQYAIRTGMRAYPNPKCLHHRKWSLCKFALQGVNVAPSSIVHKLDRNCLGRNNEHLGLTISRVSLRKLLQTP